MNGEINYARLAGLLEGKLYGLSLYLEKAGFKLTEEEAIRVNRMSEELIEDALKKAGL